MRKKAQPFGNRYPDSCALARDLCEKQHQGVVVERILDTATTCLTVDRTLELRALPSCLCPPLSLCRIEVTDIRPSCSPADCEKTKSYDLSLTCHIVDARGGRACTTACIKVDLPRCAIRVPRGSVLRLGAQIKVLCASFMSCSQALVRLDIRIKSIVSDCAAFLPRGSCESGVCAPLPLYPRIAPPQRRASPYKCLRTRKKP